MPDIIWKGTTQGSFQQSLVEIGSVVTEEKIFFKFHPPFFLFLTWRPFWLEVGITGHNFGRGPPKDHSTKVWLQLAQWFLTRRFFAYLCLICIIGRHRKSSKFIKYSVIYVKKLIIMFIQFKFGHILA